MINDIYDMDTQKKVRYVSESYSEGGTSGYSTVSPGPVGVLSNHSHSSSSSLFSMPPSPAMSPSTALQSEFCNLRLPSNSSPSQQQLHKPQEQHLPPLQNAPNLNCSIMNYSPTLTTTATNPVVVNFQDAMQCERNSPASLASMKQQSVQIKSEYPAQLRILEQPSEKFRFRYKSEMHGTHGSLNGMNSKRTPKTFPEVQLEGFAGNAVILCSLFQTDVTSPHSHQLIVRRDEVDICDPHKLYVSPEKGYVAQFQNMGIIHTAKKFIYDELLKKKRNRLIFELGRSELSTREEQLLRTETEKEAKCMNLNQVRLCFEAFKIEDDNSWTRIAAPVYTHSINNRKSAQTGDLRICRLSIATGNVCGGDDLILLVEKVSKKNIKVRFYEINEDEEIVWEAYGKFRESDVHHQYAIVCTTPPYGNKDIEKPVDVLIELLRPSDDERSYPPVNFQYKPRSAVVSRKRRRTYSSATNSCSTGSTSNSTSSFELPKTVQEQTMLMQPPPQQQLLMQKQLQNSRPTISEEYNKEWLLNSEELRRMISNDSEELLNICPVDVIEDLMLEHDGVSPSSTAAGAVLLDKNIGEEKKRKLLLQSLSTAPNKHFEAIMNIYEKAYKGAYEKEARAACAQQVAEIFNDYWASNEDCDTLMHEIVMMDKVKEGIKMCEVLKYFNLQEKLNKALNSNGESCLHCACLHNKPHFIRPLLMLGCDPNIQDRAGNTALHIAVQEGNKSCLEGFLNYMSVSAYQRRAINLKLTNDAGLSALHLAVRNNSLELVEQFLRYDKNAALVRNTMDGNNVLHTAVLHKNVALIKLLLQLQIGDLNSRNSAGRTAMELTNTLEGGARKVIAELLQQQTICNNDDGVSSPSVIKEEDMTSSSSNSDDDEVEDCESMDHQPLELTKVKVEEEDCESDGNRSFDADTKLHTILSNEQNFELLSRRLDMQDRWRKLVRLLNMQHLMCLWTNAAAMLSYLRSNVSSICHEDFIKALKQVDEEALLIFEFR